MSHHLLQILKQHSNCQSYRLLRCARALTIINPIPHCVLFLLASCNYRGFTGWLWRGVCSLAANYPRHSGHKVDSLDSKYASIPMSRSSGPDPGREGRAQNLSLVLTPSITQQQVSIVAAATSDREVGCCINWHFHANLLWEI
jgi:hypothetical protein